MKQFDGHQYRMLEHGLQIEETLAANDVEGVKHLARYWYARSLVLGLSADVNAQRVARRVKVLDAGCGCGYGARILAEGTDADVYGADKDKRALNAAHLDYGTAEHLTFRHVDVEATWPSAFAGVDFISAFDIFEHLAHRDYFLEQCANRLAPTGRLVLYVNTAGREVFDPKPSDAKCRYDAATLYAQLSRYFAAVRTAYTTPCLPFADTLTAIGSHIAQNYTGAWFDVAEGLLVCDGPKPGSVVSIVKN
jgi:SAM-dependent methyltransferase